MKIVIINKSDSTGGAAVVSHRLMEALRGIGVDARMLVVEKLTDSPYVELAASSRVVRKSFLAERLKIFIANGLNRSTLFKIDTASDGLPLWNHPLVRDADAVLLNWINQGMLSLQGVEKILRLGKPVVWTMHDMWCMTGVCHHAGECSHYLKECG
ncbi:MAG: glycosyl transferase, partial [Muribaculaceae bacterium]|nr:glycosyl transferase [Muribaculaceae bacterium]